MNKSDILIIGSGVAGFSLAIRLTKSCPNEKINVLTKDKEDESNTKYAQGGIAAVWDGDTDNFEKHIADTLDAGDDLCSESAVSIVVKEGPEVVAELIEWGAKFDREKANPTEYDLGREGGHSENRILHYKDITGWEIQRTLLEELNRYPNIDFHEHYFAIDLLTQHHMGYTIIRVTPGIECYGARACRARRHRRPP